MMTRLTVQFAGAKTDLTGIEVEAWWVIPDCGVLVLDFGTHKSMYSADRWLEVHEHPEEP